MDDYLDSVKTRKEEEKLVKHVIYIYKQGSFNIRDWISNSKQLLTSKPSELPRNMNLTVPQRILGLNWFPEENVVYVFQ